MFRDEDYECYECGTRMKREGDVLICPNCGHSVDVDDYTSEEEDYEEVFGSHNTYVVSDRDDDFPEEFPGEKYEDIY